MGSNSIESELTSILLASNDHRAILKNSFSLLKKLRRGFSFAQFAKQAGFSSRNYVRDVVVGTKKITPGSVLKFTKTLGYTENMEAYFILLVAAHDNRFNFKNLTPGKLNQETKRLRSRIEALHQRKPLPHDATTFYFSSESVFIFAALGQVGKGATLEEVVKRTKLPSTLCKKSLDAMIEANMVRMDNYSRRYLPGAFHWLNLGSKEKSPFQSFYLYALKRSMQKAISDFNSSDHAFLSSVLSTKKRRLPELKKKMQELFLEFAESAEDPEGDVVICITSSLT